MSANGPLLICSRPFPPKLGGSSVLSRNLWGAWPANDLVAFSEMQPGVQVDPTMTLAGVRVELAAPWLAQHLRIRSFCEPMQMFAVRRGLLRLARDVKPRAIWANWPSTGFLLGAWLAARELHLPLYVHMHDTWQESLPGFPITPSRLAPRLFERRVLRDARRVFAITEEASAFFQQKHGLSCYVLKHAIPDADLAAHPECLREPVDNVIHYAGAMYPLMNLDAILNLVRALGQCKSEVALEGYTFTPEASAALGIAGPRVSLRFAPKAEVMAAQRRAAILFMPLAFKSWNPVEIRTVFPTKLLEYFVSGRPILVHAPPDSWAARAARQDGWGEVVDQPDPRALADAIDALFKNKERQRALVTAAFREARNRAASQVAEALRQELARCEAGGV